MLSSADFEIMKGDQFMENSNLSRNVTDLTEVIKEMNNLREHSFIGSDFWACYSVFSNGSMMSEKNTLKSDIETLISDTCMEAVKDTEDESVIFEKMESRYSYEDIVHRFSMIIKDIGGDKITIKELRDCCKIGKNLSDNYNTDPLITSISELIADSCSLMIEKCWAYNIDDSYEEDEEDEELYWEDDEEDSWEAEDDSFEDEEDMFEDDFEEDEEDSWEAEDDFFEDEEDMFEDDFEETEYDTFENTENMFKDIPDEDDEESWDDEDEENIFEDDTEEDYEDIWEDGEDMFGEEPDEELMDKHRKVYRDIKDKICAANEKNVNEITDCYNLNAAIYNVAEKGTLISNISQIIADYCYELLF